MTVPVLQTKSSKTLLLCGVAACVLTVAVVTVATVEVVVPRAVQAAMAASRAPAIPTSMVHSIPAPLLSAVAKAQSAPVVPTPVAPPIPQLAATQPALPDQATVAAFVTKVTHGQGQLVSEFQGPYGLTGAVLEGSQPGQTQKIVSWILPNMQGMLVGSLLDPLGNNLTQTAFNAQGIALPNGTPSAGASPEGPGGSAPIPPQTLSAEMKGAGFTSFSEGSGPTHLTIFMDPNCSYCHLLWQELHAIPNYQSKFTIQWVPVSIIGPTSAGRGAAIIRGTAITQAGSVQTLAPGVSSLDYDETNYNASDETGGIPPSSDSATLAEIESNTSNWQALMSAKGQQPGTPTLIVNGTRIIVGAPDQQSLEALASAPASPAP